MVDVNLKRMAISESVISLPGSAEANPQNPVGSHTFAEKEEEPRHATGGSLRQQTNEQTTEDLVRLGESAGS